MRHAGSHLRWLLGFFTPTNLLTHAAIWLTRRLAASSAIGWHQQAQSGLIKSPDGGGTGAAEWIVLLPSRVSHGPNVVLVWFGTTKPRPTTSSCELICEIVYLTGKALCRHEETKYYISVYLHIWRQNKSSGTNTYSLTNVSIDTLMVHLSGVDLVFSVAQLLAMKTKQLWK